MRDTHESMPDKIKSLGSTREKLIWAATKLFAQKGFKGATVREIARLAKIRESQINHHFGSKEELLRSCLGGLEMTRLIQVEKYFSKPCLTSDDLRIRLEFLIDDLVEAHLQSYEQMKILYFIEMTDGVFPEKLQKTWFQLFSKLVEFLEGCKKTGLVKKSANTRTFVEITYNSLSYSILFHNHMKVRTGIDLMNPKERQKFIHDHLEIMLPGICT